MPLSNSFTECPWRILLSQLQNQQGQTADEERIFCRHRNVRGKGPANEVRAGNCVNCFQATQICANPLPIPTLELILSHQDQPAQARVVLPCIHRGLPTGGTVLGETCCGGEFSIPLLACGIHGACTERHQVENQACCDYGRCKDYIALGTL